MHLYTFKNFIWIAALFILSTDLFAQSPGAVDGYSIWLKGDFDQPQTAFDLLNFNKSPKFNSLEKINVPHSIDDIGQATIFTVYKAQKSSSKLPVWEITGAFGELSLTTEAISNGRGKKILSYSMDQQMASVDEPNAIINTYIRNKGRNASESASELPANLTFGQASETGVPGNFNGTIAEFIFYERILGKDELHLLESYLAIKYGISLQKDYWNSAKKKVWNYQKNIAYSSNIAGIARDDQAGLYQIKSAADNNPEQLIIGLNQTPNAEVQPNFLLNNMDYLIWGDDGKSFLFEKEIVDSEELMVANKKWLMSASGNTPDILSTHLTINLNDIVPADFPLERIALVINRSAQENFSLNSNEIIYQDRLPLNGVISFNKVSWDTDKSGSDLFSFVLLPENWGGNKNIALNAKEISYQVFPNPALDGKFEVSIALAHPSDIEIQVFDLQQRLVDVKVGKGKSNYRFSGFKNSGPGAYTLMLIAGEEEISHKIIIE